MGVSENEIRQYERDGYLAPLDVCEASAAASYRRQFDELEAITGREQCQVGLLNRHLDTAFLWEIATSSAILDVAEALMGPDIILAATHAFCKYGPSERFVAWHQDLTYWQLEPAFALTFWYAIDDSDPGNGCMRVIPETHRSGIRDHVHADEAGNLLSANQALPVSPDEEARARDVVLRSGQASIHDGSLIHGSLANSSDRRRCGLTIRLTRPDVIPRHPKAAKVWPGVLVRGEDRYGHFGARVMPFPLAAVL